MKWYVTNGEDWKAFNTREEAIEFLQNNPDWYELMA